MPENQIIAEIREACPPVDVSHRSISCRHYGIGWLATPVALQAPDVQALVHLQPSVRTHPNVPLIHGLRRCPRKTFPQPRARRAPGFVVGNLKASARPPNNSERELQPPILMPSHGTPFWASLATLLRPSTTRSASSRLASGVKTRTPSEMRLFITGAASQRASPN